MNEHTAPGIPDTRAPLITMTAAHRECVSLMSLLDRHGSMDFESPQTERIPEYSTSYLFGEARGKMLGVLVCRNGNGTETVLKAFSSQYNGSWRIPGWVPPVIDPAAFDSLVSPVDAKIKELDRMIEADPDNPSLKKERKNLSVGLMSQIHDLYRFRDFSGQNHSLRSLWPENAAGIPGGTGDCCAPKLLHYAYLHGLVPVSLAEFYYGKDNASGTKRHGVFYPPCREKCEPLLRTLAPGLADSSLTLLYKDDHIAVAEKPAGMLSIPGKGPDKLDSASYRITRLFPESIPQPSVHRLDMATSGLLVFGLTQEAHRKLSIQFQNRQVEKRYAAVLDGVPERIKENPQKHIGMSGTIALPFRLDPDNRPHQIYDETHGKTGITEWTLTALENGHSGPRARIAFVPKTGRTHQLRLHAAHEKGLGCPIAGDRLYGLEGTRHRDSRLLLHAEYLRFVHPHTGNLMEFVSPPPF